MAFVKNLAKGGLFGLTGLAATGAFDHKKKDKPQQSLVTGDYPGSSPTPSLLNSKSGY
jgi:hypothetical protein